MSKAKNLLLSAISLGLLTAAYAQKKDTVISKSQKNLVEAVDTNILQKTIYSDRGYKKEVIGTPIESVISRLGEQDAFMIVNKGDLMNIHDTIDLSAFSGYATIMQEENIKKLTMMIDSIVQNSLQYLNTDNQKNEYKQEVLLNLIYLLKVKAERFSKTGETDIITNISESDEIHINNYSLYDLRTIAQNLINHLNRFEETVRKTENMKNIKNSHIASELISFYNSIYRAYSKAAELDKYKQGYEDKKVYQSLAYILSALLVVMIVSMIFRRRKA